VLDIILERVIHSLFVKEDGPKNLEKVFLFSFSFFLEGKKYFVLFGTVVIGILEMHPRKHDLHFLVGVELLPHAFVNISNEIIFFNKKSFF
jgi:hypothetical protein